jgi:uncharacterized membrane protein
MASFHVYAGHDATLAAPVVRKIGFADVIEALRLGYEDFLATPTYLVFLGFIYPFCGLVLASISSYRGALHILFPLASGFALVGPIAAIGLYELSRRREIGLPSTWQYAFAVFRSPSIPSIVAMGLVLAAIFAAWLATAHGIYVWLFAEERPASLDGFLSEIVSTASGRALIVVGCLVGFVFSVLTLCISVVSFPLLLDRDAGLAAAIGTSIEVARKNPLPIAFWGLIVAAALLIGSLPLFVGLALVVPILGHATWHLYRKTVERDPSQEHPVDWSGADWGKSAKASLRPHSFLFPERPPE